VGYTGWFIWLFLIMAMIGVEHPPQFGRIETIRGATSMNAVRFMSQSMQEVIRRLHEFWAAHGCTIWQPYSEKVGAGTMNPATVLRVLGPEPWNVAYVEPSYPPRRWPLRRKPNRMQMHHQYQVILKPDPGNPQELYLASLEAIGLDRTATTSALWRTTGNRPRWARGGWAGKSGSTARRSPSSPTSSRRAACRSTR
jgi:hypothetical protein